MSTGEFLFGTIGVIVMGIGIVLLIVGTLVYPNATILFYGFSAAGFGFVMYQIRDWD